MNLPRRRERPADLAAVGRRRHLLSHHGIDPSADAAVIAAGVALAERLVSFVDEHVAAPECVDQAEDLLQVALGRTHPFIAEILHFN